MENTNNMPKTNLVIVESPSKAKTIGKYLGPDFTVKASMGHLRDLQKSSRDAALIGRKKKPESFWHGQL